ncbi:DUF6875 domain-containing protein [Streptomyces sp. NPDC055107]
MLSHPAGDVTLFEPDHPDLPAAAAVVLAWARSYLCRPHPELGRGGDVCPYTAVSLERGGLFLAVHPGRPDLRAVLTAYRDWFPDLPPREGPGARYRTVLVVLPDATPGEIDRAQRELKHGFVERGLMIGEFHPGPPSAPGLWNADFRPMRSPLPLLAVRHMVAADAPFLRADPEHLAAYRRRFGDRGANR